VTRPSRTRDDIAGANAARSSNGRTGCNIACSNPRGGVSRRDDGLTATVTGAPEGRP
jgi:hypothetical protein